MDMIAVRIGVTGDESRLVDSDEKETLFVHQLRRRNSRNTFALVASLTRLEMRD